MYAVVVMGNMFYFDGLIPNDKVSKIESLIDSIQILPFETDPNQFKKEFFLQASSNLNINLKEITIDHIYRRNES